MKTLSIIALMLLFIMTVNGQSKKDIKESLVSHETVWKYDFDDGEEKKYKEAEYSFNKDGDILIEKTFDENGKVLTHFEYKYDDMGNNTTQITYDSKGKITKREEFTYKGRLKVEKKTFSAEGKLKSKKVYEYKYYQ